MSGDVVERSQSFEFKGKTYYRWPIMNGPSGSSTRISDKPFPVVCPCCGQDSNSQAAEIEQLRKERDEALQAVDAFSEICVELGVERDNEAGLIAAAELKRLLADARAALEPFARMVDRLAFLGGSQLYLESESGRTKMARSWFRRARTLTNGGENGR